MQAIIDSIRSTIETIMGFGEFIFDFMLWLPRSILHELTDWLITAIQWVTLQIDVPAINALMGNIPGSVWFFAGEAQVEFGIKTVLAAYSIRFVIRRIPVIG